MIRFHVYAPNAPRGRAIYTAPWWLVVPIWLLYVVRGLRHRLWGPPLGRKVTLEEMRESHPGRPERCLCRGEGVIVSHRGGQRGVSFCARMLEAFRGRYVYRLANSRSGPRWIAGQAPEDMMGVERRAG